MQLCNGGGEVGEQWASIYPSCELLAQVARLQQLHDEEDLSSRERVTDQKTFLPHKPQRSFLIGSREKSALFQNLFTYTLLNLDSALHNKQTYNSNNVSGFSSQQSAHPISSNNNTANSLTKTEPIMQNKRDHSQTPHIHPHRKPKVRELQYLAIARPPLVEHVLQFDVAVHNVRRMQLCHGGGEVGEQLASIYPGCELLAIIDYQIFAFISIG
jgi:hypothetical protein